jgi:predicted transcriptional regulator
MKLSDELNNILVSEQISVTQLAARLNVSSAMVSMVISGNAKPGLKFLRGLRKSYRKICNAVLDGKYD